MLNDLVTIENLKNLVTIASAVVAWAAFVLSIANFRIQRKMLKINSDKEDRQQSSIVTYHKRSSRLVGDSETIFTIDATVTNQSEVANSLVRSSLAITYPAGILGENTIYIHSSGSVGEKTDEGEAKMPLKLSARESVAARFSFPVKSEILRGAVPVRTVAIFEDADGRSVDMSVGF